MNTSGLIHLVRGVRQYFVEYDVDAIVTVGRKERSKQTNQSHRSGAQRVVFIPGDLGGRGGRLTGARSPGQNPRPLVTWEKLALVSIWAVDGEHPHDEEKQLAAVEDLFEWTVRAVQNVARADALWGSVTWTTSPVELAFGWELLVELTHSGPLFDVASEVVRPLPVIRPLPLKETG